MRPVLLSMVGLACVLGLFLFWWNPGPIFYFSAGWVVVIALLLWFGNSQLTVRLDRWLPWTVYGNWRFFIHLVLGLLYLLFLINVIYVSIKVSLTDSAATMEQMVVMNVWGAAIFIPVFSLYFSLHFLRHWRKSVLQVEQIQKEKMRSQLDSLKNHLDPHFLFNNLNILASLIDKDKEASKAFIEKFADVYRTLLRTKSDDLILVEDELQFIQAYMYLIRVRFENNIVFVSNVSRESHGRLLPPLTLQMLIENAIKHNLIGERQPLQIELLSAPDHYLVVRNTLYPRAANLSEASGSGLNNIQQRFAHFTPQPVRVERTSTHFEVHIPTIEMELA